MVYKSGILMFAVGLTARELSELNPSKKVPELIKPQLLSLKNLE